LSDQVVHPIEAESYRRLADRLDLGAWPPGPADVVARVVHATGDPGLAESMVVDELAVEAGTNALGAGAPVVCDVEMVRAGLAVPARCLLGSTDDPGEHPSRSAAAMARALDTTEDGAVVVVGCAPTALAEVNRRLADGSLRPALVVGVPVGFVGAVEAKEELVAAAAAAGVPAITLRGERGGAAVAAAVLNALHRRAVGTRRSGPALFLIGHGTRSAAGAAQVRQFAEAVAAARPAASCGAGYIEFMSPGLDEAIDALVADGANRVVAVPLVLLGAGHLKDDGPAALARARHRHPGIRFAYARDLGVHPLVLETVSARIAGAASQLGAPLDAVVLVGRGSTDPDANADLAKVARLLADGRSLTEPLADGGARETSGGTPPLGHVVPAFVSLARPDVVGALEQCRRLGAQRVAVVPYFLFTGVLVERIAEQVAAWATAHPDVELVVGDVMGVDDRLVELVWTRHAEAAGDAVAMNCDSCLYRAPLPGYEHRLGAAPFATSQTTAPD